MLTLPFFSFLFLFPFFFLSFSFSFSFPFLPDNRYNAGWALFTNGDGSGINEDADSATCATMLDHSFSGEKQDFVVEGMADHWIAPSANAFASRINWHQVMGTLNRIQNVE